MSGPDELFWASKWTDFQACITLLIPVPLMSMQMFEPLAVDAPADADFRRHMHKTHMQTGDGIAIGYCDILLSAEAEVIFIPFLLLKVA